ncbi:MAG: hypothetical protein Q4C60_07825 [Eubacteriales bacterium]|nr:hypothetical protein [Eubacteriales bacterium]
MMTRGQIEEILNKTGIEYRYYQFDEREAVEPPFLVWYLPGSDNFAADGRVYYSVSALNLELYTDQKDFAAEEAVEQALNGAGIYWDKTESYLDDEQMYEVLYEMEV